MRRVRALSLDRRGVDSNSGTRDVQNTYRKRGKNHGKRRKYQTSPQLDTDKKIIEELPVEYSAVLLPDFCFTEKSFGLISKLWKKVFPLPKFLYLFVRKEEPVNFFISINVFHAMALERCVIDAFHKLSNNDETILTNEWFKKFHAYYWKIIFKRLNELPNVKRCEAKMKAAYFLFNNMPMPVSPSCHCGLLSNEL